jgi:23S rRNA-/tRNA-specific pseudouridylate synthase
MPKSKKTFKIPPKKYHPKGLSILYEDHDILVVEKASGLLTVSTDRIKDNTAYYHLNSYVKKGNQKSKNRVFIVHRLDRDTSGILVFAKSEDSKRFLQDQWHGFKKKYYALFHGMLSEKEGIITSYLAIDLFTGRKNQIRVHFAEKGFPVVGDKIYGEKDKGIKRLALHSAYLSFLHPVTKEQMTFETALPAYFKSLLNS